MKIASWNVNSIRKRMDRVVPWLAQHRPDVVCLQETKVEDDAFPRAVIEAMGYQVVCHGQKTYNGVAILTLETPHDVVRGFGDDAQDPQARFLVVTVSGVRVGTVYVPNGQAVGSEKFRYKLGFLQRWQRWLAANADASSSMALCGDMNIAPEDRDVCDPVAWKDQVLCHPAERAALAEVCRWGLTDTFRQHHPEPGFFTWWDYRQLCFPKNLGLRIDLILCTPSLAARCTAASIDRSARKGVAPSDHAPVIAEFE
jgi:exodeoxyribonuclease-3